jgi:hypothetical protein
MKSVVKIAAFAIRNSFSLPFASLLFAATLTFPTPARAATQDELDVAIDKAVDFLLSRQQRDGSWETVQKQVNGGPGANFAWGGDSAIATYALLTAGMKPIDPHLRKATDWLKGEDLHGTYAVALRAGACNAIYEHLRNKDKEILAARDRDRDFILYSRLQRGPNAGFYGCYYGDPQPPAAGGFAPLDPKGPPEGASCDRCNSQVAVFAAWALEQAGAEIPTQYWLDEDAAWKKAQLAGGGWDYSPDAGNGATDTMTCAGLATLYITQNYLLRSNVRQFDACTGGFANENIQRGLAWLDQHIAPILAGPGAQSMYRWYGLSRLGLASGRRYFGGVDWYKAGAEFMVRSQKPDGSWGAIPDTAFAILFLTTSRAPVMMQKLQYTSGTQTDPWNERPRDLANLVKWVGPHALCGFITWELTSLDAPHDDLHDAPILFISGSEALQFSDKDMAKLRAFVEEGGMILGNADCTKEAFVTSFKDLGKKLFPKYEFRKLPPSHPIFDEQYHAAKWKRHPELQAMSNGVRELMVISPDTDMAKAWQTESSRIREEYFMLADNIFLYATGKENLLNRGTNHIVHPDAASATREIRIARLEVGDNWDPEPGAWRRMTALMHNQHHLDIRAEPVTPGQGKLADYKIAALTGTSAFQLSGAQRAEIRHFVDNGGALIVDAAGGAAAFANAAEDELKQTFGDAAKGLQQPLPFSHGLYADPKIDEVRYRSFARHLMSGHSHEPQLRAIAAPNGRIVVFFSREDITAGLVGQQVDGIIGYMPNVASKLMENMILYADHWTPFK